MRIRALPCLVGAAILWAAPASAPDLRATQCLVLVTLDGARVEEVFGGMDAPVLEAVAAASGQPKYGASARQRFGAATREERRRRLLPFFWGTLVPRFGSVAGDRERGSHVRVTNAYRLSYPGYAELLTGRARDEAVRDNDPRRSPYPSVLEALRDRLDVGREEVAVFASWRTMGMVAESQPGALVVDAGPSPSPDRDPLVGRLSEPRFEAGTRWEGVRSDAFTFELALAYLRARHPRVLYVSFDETDELAHEGQYEAYLEALHRFDRQLERLWQALGDDPFYRDRTSLVIGVDHGRGRGLSWRDHGAGIPGSEDVWVAVVSPDRSRRGSEGPGAALTQDRIATTMAGLMGVDF